MILKRILLILGALALVACATATESTDEPSRAEFSEQITPTPTLRSVIEVTHVIETIYYPVSGVTTEEIFASVEANGPKSLHEGGDTFTTGLAEFEPLLTYSLKNGFSCTLSSATLAINSIVTLPRHTNIAALSPRQGDKWRQFAAEVALHEQTHVDISLATMKEFAEVAPNTARRCNELESRLDNSFDEFFEIEDERQEVFHADELARSNAARAPLQSQLADAETELARLDTRIDGLSTQIAALATEITRIERPYRFSGIPAAIYDEYDWTVNQHNKLIEESNTLGNSYNAVVEKENRLFEELAWAP